MTRTTNSRSNDEQPIIAQCTPTGSGALALLRLSGDNAISLASNFTRLSSGKDLTDVPSHTVHYGTIQDNDTAVDTVMAIVMRAPRTFTGQDTVEITCHNNPFLIEQIISLAIRNGARLADNGEFAQRAFMNEKIDLIQAESINDLIHANTRYALKRALAQVDGSLSQWVTSAEKTLLHAIALSEASFEFIDEEIDFKPQLTKLIGDLHAACIESQQAFSAQQNIREGIRVTLIGSVNAGKSSLFNTLIKKDRAIVTSIAGTTRDALEAGIYRENYYITFVDTAGLRQTDNLIEQEGINRSMTEAATADVILLAIDQSRALSDQERGVYDNLIEQYDKKIIPVHTKCDLDRAETYCTTDSRAIAVSSIAVPSSANNGINKLETAINQKIKDLLAVSEAPFMLNKRQHALITSLEQHLDRIAALLDTHIEYELLSIHLKDALETLCELTGRSVSEAGMDAVFREFCVGK